MSSLHRNWNKPGYLSRARSWPTPGVRLSRPLVTCPSCLTGLLGAAQLRRSFLPGGGEPRASCGLRSLVFNWRQRSPGESRGGHRSAVPHRTPGRMWVINPFTPKFKKFILPTVLKGSEYNNLASEWAMKSQVLHTVRCSCFWWGCRGSLKLIALGSERVKQCLTRVCVGRVKLGTYLKLLCMLSFRLCRLCVIW